MTMRFFSFIDTQTHDTLTLNGTIDRFSCTAHDEGICNDNERTFSFVLNSVLERLFTEVRLFFRHSI